MIEEKVFEFGERRRVTMAVWLNDGQSFTPASPTYELTKIRDVVQSGVCEATEDGGRWNLTAEVEPPGLGDYRLSFLFGLGNEKIRRSVRIKVI